MMIISKHRTCQNFPAQNRLAQRLSKPFSKWVRCKLHKDYRQTAFCHWGGTHELEEDCQIRPVGGGRGGRAPDFEKTF
jgi:hypothetical protein